MSEPQTYSTVLQQELHFIQRRREHTRDKRPAVAAASKTPDQEINDERKFQKEALKIELFGVALSGGGIRSATFNLGVLQRLAELRLLKDVDYLSTVSGGGYIGGWLEAWLKREGVDGAVVENVEQELIPSRFMNAEAKRVAGKGLVYDLEPTPVRQLRAYSRYLTPRYGFFSADSWTLIAIYVRNVLLNQLHLLAAAFLVVLGMRLLLHYFAMPTPNDAVSTVITVGVLICAGLALSLVTRELGLEHNRVVKAKRRLHANSLQFAVLIPLLLSAIGVVWLFTGSHRPDAQSERIFTQLPDWLARIRPVANEATGKFSVWTALRCSAVFAGVHAIINVVGTLSFLPTALRSFSARDAGLRALWTTLASIISGAIAGFLYYVVLSLFIWPARDPAAALTIGPPLLLFTIMVASFAEVGLLSDYLEEGAREWWSRFNAWTMIYALGWLAVFGITLYGPYAGHWLVGFAGHYAAQVKIGAVVSWLGTTLGGVLAGKSPQTKDGSRNRPLEIIGMVAPYVFIVGLVILVSWLVTFCLAANRNDLWSHYWDSLHDFSCRRFLMLAAAWGIALLYARRIDVNVFSLHAMYTNRLVRCYLGASRNRRNWASDNSRVERRDGAPTNSQPPARRQSPLTGLDPWDDLPLRDLRIGEETGPPDPKTGAKTTYWGPFPIINTSLNVVRGEELALQDRKAESFVLTPLYCGSRLTGYRELTLGADEHITLGRAVSVSGAAVDPNMGYHTSPALAALMTVFNVRLGRWIQNPANTGLEADTWTGSGPSTGGWLFRELLGWTDEKSDYVHLSDGGHFENLGIYELVRRRCKYILAMDAGADPEFSFYDLGSAIEKCKVDFGVTIDVNVDALRADAATRRSRWHCAVGTIRYSEVHGDKGDDGVLIYVKTSLTDDEPSDVSSHAWSEVAFPHTSTVDQFFSESQFESYRALGYHVLGKTLGDGNLDPGHFVQLAPAKTFLFKAPPREPVPEAAKIKGLFAAVQNHWQALPASVHEKFAKLAADVAQLHRQMMDSDKFDEITRQVYPEVFPDGIADQAADTPKSPWELHFVFQVLQLFQTVWVEMLTGSYGEHSLNRSWNEIIRRWARAKLVQKYWDDLKGDLSSEFVEFFGNLRDRGD
jgi:hypothetical protein